MKREISKDILEFFDREKKSFLLFYVLYWIIGSNDDSTNTYLVVSPSGVTTFVRP